MSDDVERVPGRFAVACGGTGGHMFPGMATAQALQRRGHVVTLWVAGRDVEAEGLDGWSGPVVRIPSRGVTSRNPLVLLRAIFSWVSAVRRARCSMAEELPDALLAMGSYSSVGPVLAAYSLRIPVVLHEANAVPGRAVSMLARFSRSVATTFPDAERGLPARKCVRTGLPLRRMLAGEKAVQGDRPFTVLVMGGSLGAHRLNELAVDSLCAMWARGDRDLRVIHLAGRKDEEWVRARYAQVGVPAAVHGFLADMASAYAEADIAVCRAGASSCMELCASRVPALLVPLPHAVRDHQKANACIMSEREAALWIAQEEMTPSDIESFVVGSRRTPERMARMRSALGGMAMPDADRRLSDLLESVAESGH